MIRDHLLSSNQGYGRILYELEREKDPMCMARLAAHPFLAGMTCDLSWITKSLWTFLVRNMTRSYRRTINALVDGEELNGLDL